MNNNIEEDIKFIEKMIKEYKIFGDLDNPEFEDTKKIYKTIENILADRERYKNMYEAEHRIHLTRNEQLDRKENAVEKAKKYDSLVEKIEEELKETDAYLEESENKTYKSITQELENYQKAIGKKEALMEILKLTRWDSMSKADRMFEELGYTKKETTWKEDNKKHFIEYNTNDTQIQFSIDTKHILITNILNLQELQAINEKVKELGWNE